MFPGRLFPASHLIQLWYWRPECRHGHDSLDANGSITAASAAINLTSETDDNVTVNDPTAPTYSGAVTFAGGNTISNTSGWAGFQPNDEITVSGAIASANDGTFTIQSISGDTLTLTAGKNLTAGTVDLVTTDTDGLGCAIGTSAAPITTESPPQSGQPAQSLQLTATSNDGGVYLQDYSPGGLTINSVVADQDGQAPSVQNGEIEYETNASSYASSNFSPTYSPGDEDVSITTENGPIVLRAFGNNEQSGVFFGSFRLFFRTL